MNTLGANYSPSLGWHSYVELMGTFYLKILNEDLMVLFLLVIFALICVILPDVLTYTVRCLLQDRNRNEIDKDFYLNVSALCITLFSRFTHNNSFIMSN